MNYWKLMLAVAGGVLIASVVVYSGCAICNRAESDTQLLGTMEQARAMYKEQTGRKAPPADELVRQFKRDTGR